MYRPLVSKWESVTKVYLGNHGCFHSSVTLTIKLSGLAASGTLLVGLKASQAPNVYVIIFSTIRYLALAGGFDTTHMAM